MFHSYVLEMAWVQPDATHALKSAAMFGLEPAAHRTPMYQTSYPPHHLVYNLNLFAKNKTNVADSVHIIET